MNKSQKNARPATARVPTHREIRSLEEQAAILEIASAAQKKDPAPMKPRPTLVRQETVSKAAPAASMSVWRAANVALHAVGAWAIDLALPIAILAPLFLGG